MNVITIIRILLIIFISHSNHKTNWFTAVKQYVDVLGCIDVWNNSCMSMDCTYMFNQRIEERFIYILKHGLVKLIHRAN